MLVGAGALAAQDEVQVAPRLENRPHPEGGYQEARHRSGAKFPDYVLPGHTKTRRRMYDLQGDQLMIVVLTRGFLCPKDRQHMLELVRFHP